MQEKQAAQAELSKQRAKARYEKRKAEARKKAGLLTPEKQAADEEHRAKRRTWQKQWREKKADGVEKMVSAMGLRGIDLLIIL